MSKKNVQWLYEKLAGTARLRRGRLCVGAVVAAVIVCGCGHYSATIRSAHDIQRTSSSEDNLIAHDLPLADWPKLQKFYDLWQLRIGCDGKSEITDDHLVALAQLDLPKLRQMQLPRCSKVTDRGIRALAKLPALEGLQLMGLNITDESLRSLAADFKRLKGLNVEGCSALTVEGFLSLTNSKTIADVSLSLNPLSQQQVEFVISQVTNVTRWTICDPHHKLQFDSLRELQATRKIMILVKDENNRVKGITEGVQ